MTDTPRRGFFQLSPLNQRRWANFKRNRRALWSLVIFVVLFGLSLFAEFIANDKPILVNYRGEYYTPIFNFYPETEFGGDFRTEAAYRDPEVKCLIRTGGLEACFDTPESLLEAVDNGVGLDGDFEKGFIRAETIAYEDYVACGGEGPAKEAGKMRAEGKDYVVQDGDVMHFRFNV